MRPLRLWEQYSRKDVHDIFSPDTNFTPQAGTWGLQGMVRIPNRAGDWVFFVTYGQSQGDHQFDESITHDGVLSWQSQPAQGLDHSNIRELIAHDERVNSIYLFLRTQPRFDYWYLGRLGYLTHDAARQQPVYFQWQILDWPPPDGFLQRAGLVLIGNLAKAPVGVRDQLELTPPPAGRTPRTGVDTNQFRNQKAPNYAERDARNRSLGLAGERLVLAYEKQKLLLAGRDDLAEKIVHVSEVEGDSAGYDVRSYSQEGIPIHIEVKTTRGDATTDLFLSANQVEFSRQNSETYLLYRLYQFDGEENSAKFFVYSGDIRERFLLSPTEYRAQQKAPVVT